MCRWLLVSEVYGEVVCLVLLRQCCKLVEYLEACQCRYALTYEQFDNGLIPPTFETFEHCIAVFTANTAHAVLDEFRELLNSWTSIKDNNSRKEVLLLALVQLQVLKAN